MTGFRKKMISVLMAGSLLLFFPVFAFSADPVLTVLVPATFPNLDPGETVSGDQSMVAYHIFSRLYTFNENMEPFPDLVTKESISKDGTTWTFEIRSGVKFHDGTPLNAAAIKYTVDRMLKRGGSQKALFEAIKEVRVHSDTGFSFVTEKPFPGLRNNLAHPASAIISPASDNKLGRDFGMRPVGSGPYRFAEWMSGDHISVVRNDAYYGERPYYAQINFKFVLDDTTRALLMETGQADVALRLLPAATDRLKGNPQVSIRLLPGRNIFYQLNNMKFPFNDIRVRRAVNYAVDKQTIIDRVLSGTGQTARSLVEAVQGTIDAGFYPFDPEKAKALIRDANAVGAKIVLLSPTTRYPLAVEVSQAVGGYLRQAGLTVEIQAVGDWPSFLEKVKRHEFDLYMLGWGGSTGDPDNAFQRLLHSKLAGNFWNVAGYKNPKVDDLIMSGASEFNQKKRMQIYAEIQKIVWDEAPWLFMYRETSRIAQKANIKNIRILPGTEMPYFWQASP